MVGSGIVTHVVDAVISITMETVIRPHQVLLILIVAAILKVTITCPSGVTGALVTEP